MDKNSTSLRVFKVAKEFNIDLSTINEFLAKQGYDLTLKPLTKLSIEQYNLIKSHYYKERPLAHNDRSKHDFPEKLGSKKVGHIKFINSVKGFGFIYCWEDNSDYYFNTANIRSSPINDFDHIIFQSIKSHKKNGKSEAVNITLVSEYTYDIKFLAEQFIKYNNNIYRRDITHNVTENELIFILNKELLLFNIIDNEKKLFEFNKLSQFYLSLDSNEEIKKRIKSIISDRLGSIAGPILNVELWLNGTIHKEPDINSIKYFSKSANRKEILKILKRISSTLKLNLIEQYAQDSEPEYVVDLVLE